MARRFIVDKENINELQDKYVITGPEVKHIQVLRLNIGDEVVVNSGIYKICQMTRDEVILEYIKEAPIVGPIPEDYVDVANKWHQEMLEKLAAFDDDLMMQVLDGEEPSVEKVKEVIRKATI